jgi:uncharacterized glyoxalase superfamily protein PhnB
MTLKTNRSIPDCVIIPELAYRDVTEAAAWLCEKFGFKVRLRIGNHRVQLLFGQGAVVVKELPPAEPPEKIGHRHSVLVRVRDIDDHHATAVRQGVRIVRSPSDYPYGERQYTAEDLGGHLWTFSQTIADSDPTSWGGSLS